MFMYVGVWDHNPEKTRGLAIYSFDSHTGRISFIKKIYEDVAFNMSYVDEKRKYLYILNETEHIPDVPYLSGALYCFRINPESGDLTEVFHQPTGCPCPDYLDFDLSGKYMVISHHSSPDRVSVFDKDAEGKWVPKAICSDQVVQLWEVKEDGTLGQLLDVKKHGEGKEITFNTKGAPHLNHPHSCLRAPQDNLFCVPDKGDSYVYMYGIDEEKKELVLKDRILADEEGCQARYCAFHPEKPYLFINQELHKDLDMRVSSFRYTKEGKLEKTGVYSCLDDGTELVPGAPFQSQQGFVIRPDGKYVYSAIRRPAMVAAFAVDEENGSLSLIQNIPVPGKDVRGINVTPDGRYLVTSCLYSADITVFSIGEDGRLAQVCNSTDVLGGSYINFFRTAL